MNAIPRSNYSTEQLVQTPEGAVGFVGDSEWDKYHGFSHFVIFSQYEITKHKLKTPSGCFKYLESDLKAVTASSGNKPDCECGAHIVHGKNCSKVLHALWCPARKGVTDIN